MLKDQAQSPQQTITQESYQFSQSLYPPPDLLADYAKANPQASDTLLQQAHEAHMAQLAIQAQQAKAHSRNRTISILSALTIASITVLAGYYALAQGATLEGLSLSASGLAGLVMAFLRSQHPKD